MKALQCLRILREPCLADSFSVVAVILLTTAIHQGKTKTIKVQLQRAFAHSYNSSELGYVGKTLGITFRV